MTSSPSGLERLVRGTLAAQGVGLAFGTVASEYVGSPSLQYVLPVLLGVLCGEAATVAAGTSRGADGVAPSVALQIRLVAAVLSVLGVGWAVLEEGSYRPLSLHRQVLLPYALAAAAALLWTLPPRRERRPPDG